MIAIALATMMAVENPDSMTLALETTVLNSTVEELEIINGIIATSRSTDSKTMDGMDFMLFYNYDKDTCVAQEDNESASDLTLRLYIKE